MLSGAMPNFATPSALVDTATKWRATASSLPSCATSASRAALALVIVSSVVNVFDDTMNSVCAGSSPRVASSRSVESTLDTKRKSSSACA